MGKKHPEFNNTPEDFEGARLSSVSAFRNTTVFVFTSDGKLSLAQNYTNPESPLKAESIPGTSVEELFPPDVSALFKKAFDKNRKGEISELNFSLETSAGTGLFSARSSPMNNKNSSDGFLVIMKEATKEIEFNEALRKSREDYKSLVEMATIGIAIISEDKLVFANPVTCEISGFSSEELSGKSFFEFLAPSEKNKVIKIHSDRMGGKSAPVTYETQIVKKDGKAIDVELSVRPIRYQGKPSMQVIIRDISVNKAAEKELLNIQEALQKKVAERTAELVNYQKHLQDVVDEKTTRLRNTVSLLRIEIKERIVAEERAEHLKKMLLAIRSINLLITRETDVQILINNVCKNLIDAGNYKNAWISLTDKDGSYMTASSTLSPEDFEPINSAVARGEEPPCFAESLTADKPWVSDFQKDICSNCLFKPDSLKPIYIISYRLKYHDRIFGVLTVYSYEPAVLYSEELGLFEEVCDDVAFALDSIERVKEKESATKALSESENRYKALFDNLGMAILFMREDMILDCNAKAAEVFRSSREDLIGIRPYNLSPRTQPDGELSAYKGAAKVQAAIDKGPQHFFWVHTRTNGEEFPAEISLNAVKIGNQNYIQALVDDISLRAEAEKALRQSENNLRTLANNVPVGIFRSDPVDGGTLLALNTALVSMFGYDSEDDLLLDSSEKLFISSESRNAFLDKLNESGVLENYETLMQRKDGSRFWASISAKILRQDNKNQPYMVDGIISDITKSKLQEENLRNSLDNFKRAIEGTVSAMSLLVEMKDPYTSGHQKGVSLLACAIAKDMGLDDNTIDCIRIASNLHDLGKLNVPLEILNKPGPLNEFEMDFLKTHPGAGYDILKAVDFPWPIAEVIHQHHERQDGSGYPRGLKGDEIMIEASIIAVADVMEAVASRRPYRASMGVEAALDIVSDGRGTLFREDVVDSCLKLFREKGFTLIDHDKRVTRTELDI